MVINLEKLEALKKEDCFSKEPVQALFNVIHQEWQKLDLNYKGILEYVRENYGEIPQFLFLAGKHLYQVNNGGHIQYFDNGYASVSRSPFTDIDLHNQMMRLMWKHNINTTLIGSQVFDIYSAFQLELDEDSMTTDFVSCPEWDGEGTVRNENYNEDDEDSDEDEYISCPHCHGCCESEETIDNPDYMRPSASSKEKWDELDSRFYLIDDEWLEFLHTYLREWLTGEKDPIKLPVNESPMVTNTEKPSPSKPVVQLTGEDGNAFSIIARTRRALRDAGSSKETVEAFEKEATSGDYSHLLSVVSQYCQVK